MKTLSHIRTKDNITPFSCLPRILFYVSVTALYFIVSNTIACAGQVTLGWDKSSEPDVVGYKVYYGTAARNYTQSINITSPDITTCTINNLTGGRKYYFAATAYNNKLIESDYSAEIFTVINPVTIPPLCAAETIYGENSEQTELLREYRDNVLSKTSEGQKIIKTYYKYSPTVTKLLEQHPELKNRAKAYIDSMLPGIRKKVEKNNNTEK